ncbi:MAG: hypothetical protein ACHQ15_04745 [Candidatus Limnocylindrales bacterium]
MSFLSPSLTARPDAPLVRVAGVTRLVAGSAWLIAAVVTTDPLVPGLVCVAGLVVLFLWSGLSPGRVARRVGIVFQAARGLAAQATQSSPAN